MKTMPIKTLENEIDNTLELTAMCRGEWCRALETKVDALEDELVEVSKGCGVRKGSKVADMSHKIMKSYNNLRGEFRF